MNVDDAEISAVQGQGATNVGTFSDPDGGPVTLTASTGNVIDNGGGNYSWSKPNAQNDEIVYITGTDNQGNKGQIAFQLRVTAAPPVPDTTPPDTTVTKKPTRKKRRKSIVRFESSEANSTFRCAVDGNDLEPCGSPTNYADLKRGKHSFVVVATDAAGNTDPTPAETNFFLRRKK